MPLVTLHDIFKDTISKRYGVGMFNAANLEFAEAIVEAAEELNAPVMIGLPERFFSYFDMETMARLCIDLANRSSVPVVVHLDHGKNFEIIQKALKYGFSSVMFDGSTLPLEENVRLTKEVVDAAKAVGVTVEGELGYVGRSGVDTSAVEYDKSLFTKPEEVVDFVEKTGVDALAIAIGTLHGVYRGTPQLDYDRLQNIRSKVKVGLVMHGGSGLPDSDFKKATQIGIDKVNVYTELSIFAMEHVRTTLETVKEWLDVSKSMRLSLKEFIKDRIATFGGAGMAGSSQAVSPKDRIANSSNVI